MVVEIPVWWYFNLMNQFFAYPSLTSPFPEASTISLHSMRWQYREMMSRWNRRLNFALVTTRFIVRLSEYIEINDPTNRGKHMIDRGNSRYTRFIRSKFGQEDEAGKSSSNTDNIKLFCDLWMLMCHSACIYISSSRGLFFRQEYKACKGISSSGALNTWLSLNCSTQPIYSYSPPKTISKMAVAFTMSALVAVSADSTAI